MSTLVRPAVILFSLIALAGALFAAPDSPAAAATANVRVGDFYFCDSSFQGGVCQTTINVGDTVVWDFSGAVYQHTTTECGASCDTPSQSPVWNSGLMSGGTFEFTFTQAGTFLYHCQVHPSEMHGSIVVQAAATPTSPPGGPTPAGGQTPAAGTTPVATTARALAPAGQGPERATTDWWWLTAIGLVGAASFGLGLALRTRTR